MLLWKDFSLSFQNHYLEVTSTSSASCWFAAWWALRPRREGLGSYFSWSLWRLADGGPTENQINNANTVPPTQLRLLNCTDLTMHTQIIANICICWRYCVDYLMLYRESFVQRDFMIVWLVLILLTGEEHFCWIILTTVFPSLVNDRVDASYLIVLFYVMKYCSHITVVKLAKRDIYDFFGCHLMCKYEKTVYVFPLQY